MSRCLKSVSTTTILDHKTFALEDEIGDGLPEFNGWVAVGPSSIWVQTPYDNFDAIVTLEEWNGEPGPELQDDRGPWDDAVTILFSYAAHNESLRIWQLTAGGVSSGFFLNRPGRYHVRVARRNGGAADQAYRDVLARFDEADWNSEACRRATQQIDVQEEYLFRFWPAAA